MAATELREKVWAAIMGAWGSYDITDDKEEVVTAVLAVLTDEKVREFHEPLIKPMRPAS